MKLTILTVALLAIGASTARADPLTAEQTKVINQVAAAEFAGEACPQFHSISAARDHELANAGLKYGSPETMPQLHRASLRARVEFDNDKSEFCRKSWRIFGLHGSHKDQLLEENHLTEAQHDAIAHALTAQIAGDGRRCPRFHAIDSAVEQERLEAQAPSEIRAGDEYMKEVNIALAIADSTERFEYCRRAWALYGPSGSYRRKMLEEN